MAITVTHATDDPLVIYCLKVSASCYKCGTDCTLANIWDNPGHMSAGDRLLEALRLAFVDHQMEGKCLPPSPRPRKEIYDGIPDPNDQQSPT